MPRRRKTWKTPPIAAFFTSAVLIAGCRSADTLTELPDSACKDPVTPVAAIQGDGYRSPMTGREARIRGIVIMVEAGSGIFIQEPASDLSRDTSDGLFVESAALTDLATTGDQVILAGTVAELGQERDTLTALTGITGFRVCARNIPLPLVDARLPLTGEEKEALEGMRLGMQQSLAVTDVYGLAEGRLRLSLNGILPAPTEVARPGRDARAQARRNRDRSIHASLAPDDRQSYSVGTGVMAASGILGHDGRGPRLLLTEPLASMPRTVYRTAPPAGDEVRVMGLNLHNYFNGNGLGGGFPAARGAATRGEFSAQRQRFTALAAHVQPALIGVMELENDGFGERSAARDFLNDLDQAGLGAWQVINPNDAPVGTDAITVGIFYRTDILQPAGRAMLLEVPPFDELSRVPIAQWFVHRPSGAAFLLVVNHFKSKGSCPEDGPNANQLDGQGCWNPARLESARRLAGWVNELLDNSVNRNALILGDLNAYRMEDPITALIDGGFKDLTASTGLQLEYSFVYRGEAGTLDYAFASPGLVASVRSARFLNFNAGFPRGMPLEYPFLGSSDHDPVVVDLRFRQAKTSD